MSSRILFLVPYPLDQSPSQRFRFEQYFKRLTESGFRYDTSSFLVSQDGNVFYRSGNILGKLWVFLKGISRRVGVLLKAQRYDFIFIHREAAPLGPPVFEWFLSQILRRRIIYDFDDAIWLTDQRNESRFLRMLKWRSKVSSICRWSYKVSCGNAYLAEFALRYNRNVVINPTTIDTSRYPSQQQANQNEEARICIGWTGSHSTLKYLELIEAVLTRLEQDHSNLIVKVIADRPPNLSNLSRVVFQQWNKETEADDLADIDIGIMPLPDDEWSKGKCGFKILQYFAMGIPAVASAVGENVNIITHGVNGFLCTDETSWYEKLTQLIRNSALRREFGRNGRKTIGQRFSMESNTANFLGLFE